MNRIEFDLDIPDNVPSIRLFYLTFLSLSCIDVCLQQSSLRSTPCIRMAFAKSSFFNSKSLERCTSRQALDEQCALDNPNSVLRAASQAACALRWHRALCTPFSAIGFPDPLLWRRGWSFRARFCCDWCLVGKDDSKLNKAGDVLGLVSLRPDS